MAPDTLSASVSILALLPELLSAYVEFAHDRAGVPAMDTEEALNQIHRLTPAYLRLLDGRPESGRPSIPSGLILGEDVDAMFVEWLASAVGGRDELDALEPIPCPTRISSLIKCLRMCTIGYAGSVHSAMTAVTLFSTLRPGPRPGG